MSKLFKLENNQYNLDTLTEEGKAIYQSLESVGIRLEYKKNEIAVLTRAKNGYIEELKTEVIEKKSGVDLGALFGDD